MTNNATAAPRGGEQHEGEGIARVDGQMAVETAAMSADAANASCRSLTDEDFTFPLDNATVDVEIRLSTRYLLGILWRRVIGWNSNCKLRIFAGRTFIVLKSRE